MSYGDARVGSVMRQENRDRENGGEKIYLPINPLFKKNDKMKKKKQERKLHNDFRFSDRLQAKKKNHK